MDYLSNSDEFIQKLIRFLGSFHIKESKEAERYETADSERYATQYLNAYFNRDSFNSYQYTQQEIYAAGITDPVMVDYYYYHQQEIPEIYQTALVENRRNDILTNYVEPNTYYRMFLGLPPINEEPLTVSNGKYVTDLTDSELLYYYQDEIPRLRELYPDAKYLDYLGYNQIPLDITRPAPNFYILKYDKSIFDETLNKIFIDYYYESLVYVERVIYHDALAYQKYYDKFMIILLLLMTAQKFIARHLTLMSNRELFDLESLRNMFYSYGLPFYEDIPIKYQRRIIKNINTLLQYKGTDRIIIDIINLFGFNNSEIVRYYLVKFHKYEPGSNEPVIDFENPENMYELSFVPVPISDPNISKGLDQPLRHIPYDEMVSDDPFWGEPDEDGDIDESLKQKILTAEFNYINTKYIGINTMIDMSKILFESCYFFNILNTLQSESKLDQIRFINYQFHPSGQYIKVFDLITALWVLMFRYFGYDDTIIYTPTAIGSIYGFDFNKSLTELQTRVEHYSRIIMQNGLVVPYDISGLNDTLRAIETPNTIEYKSDVIHLFSENRDFAYYLQDRMMNTDDYQEYKALNEIYKYNMYSRAIQNLYDTGENHVYSTYTDYLRTHDPELLSYIEQHMGSRDEIKNTIEYILYNMEIYFSSNEFEQLFMGLAEINGNIIREYLMRYIRLFKAYTVEIKDMRVLYFFGDPFFNTIRIFSFLQSNSNDMVADYVFRLLHESFHSDISIEQIEQGLLALREHCYRVIQYYQNITLDIRDETDIYDSSQHAIGIASNGLDDIIESIAMTDTDQSDSIPYDEHVRMVEYYI